MSSAARKGRTARILVPLVLLIAWLGVGGTLGPYAGKLGEVATNDQAAFLPESAESTRVTEEQKAFSADEALPALVVWTAKDGGRLPADAREAATGTLASLADAGFTAGQRDSSAEALGLAIREEKLDRVVLLGDLNGTMNDRSLTAITSQLRSPQGAVGDGFGFSWPASFPMARIDQILVTGVEPTTSWTLPATGSNHLPIAARVKVDTTAS